MTTTILPPSSARIGPVAPTEHDSRLARESSRRLSPYAKKDLRVRVTDGDGPDIELPAAAVQLLVHLLTQMAEGNAITLMPIHAELTTQQAADVLNVSRPFLVDQLENGLIPFRKVGSHRRLRLKDVLAYKQSMDRNRRQALDELAAQAQELNMGY